MELTEVAEQQAEEDTFNMLMDAWLSGTESDVDEKSSETDGLMSGNESATKRDRTHGYSKTGEFDRCRSTVEILLASRGNTHPCSSQTYSIYQKHDNTATSGCDRFEAGFL